MIGEEKRQLKKEAAGGISLPPWIFLICFLVVRNRSVIVEKLYSADEVLGRFAGGRGGRTRERRGKDAIHQLAIRLEDLYNGTLKRLKLQKNVVCDKCEGKLLHKYKCKR